MYYRRPPWDTGISPPELMEFINTHPAGRALDIGCGTGTNVVTLAQRGWQVTGIDFAPKAIAEARRKAGQAGIKAELLVEDATRIGHVRGPFDLALDMGCLHSLEPAGKQAYLENLARLLAPGGIFLLYAFVRQVEDGRGLSDEDLKNIDKWFTPQWRKDGSERGERPSAWFEYRR